MDFWKVESCGKLDSFWSYQQADVRNPTLCKNVVISNHSPRDELPIRQGCASQKGIQDFTMKYATWFLMVGIAECFSNSPTIGLGQASFGISTRSVHSSTHKNRLTFLTTTTPSSSSIQSEMDDSSNDGKITQMKKALTWEFLQIGGPAVIQLAAEPLAALVDTAYLGRLGPEVL